MKWVPILLLAAAACAGKQRTIGRSEIADTKMNRDVIEVIEQYRQAVERADADALVLMAAPNYWEDSGTPSGADDYGVDRLREIMATQLSQVREIRYSMRYVAMKHRCPNGGADISPGCRAHVEVLIDASFTVTDARGQERRPDKRDQNEFVLEWTGDKWLFVSGM